MADEKKRVEIVFTDEIDYLKAVKQAKLDGIPKLATWIKHLISKKTKNTQL